MRPTAIRGRREVIELRDGIIDHGTPTQPNRTLSHLRRPFNRVRERAIVWQPASNRPTGNARSCQPLRCSLAVATAVWGAWAAIAADGANDRLGSI